jgi:hypothetical protein
MLSRSSTSFSKFVATVVSASSRKPPVSPALTMLIMMGGKSFGCLRIASERDVPASTSSRTRARIFASAADSV